MNDEQGLSERLQMLRAAVSSTPSLLDDVMDRIGEAPPPVRRRWRRKLLAGACLATAACVVAAVVGWITIGGDDTTEIASIDGAQEAVPPAKTRVGDAAGEHDSKLFWAESMRGVKTIAERSRAGLETKDLEAFDDLQEQRGFDLARGAWAGERLGCAFGEAPDSKPQLSDFAGLWRGTAADKPEDGTSTDPVGIKITVSQDGRLEGVAFDRFAGGDEARLEDVYVVGDRLEFKVRHRTGVQVQVTLGLAGEMLKGDGIPIRSDESRCDIVLRRQRPEPPHREPEAEPSKP